MKILKRGNYDYGVIGEATCVPSLKVGDIVNLIYGGKILTKLMVKDSKGSFAMGLAQSFEKEWRQFTIVKLVDHSKINNEVLKLLGQDDFHIQDIEHVEMTVEDVERKLGYKVKIISK